MVNIYYQNNQNENKDCIRKLRSQNLQDMTYLRKAIVNDNNITPIDTKQSVIICLCQNFAYQ